MNMKFIITLTLGKDPIRGLFFSQKMYTYERKSRLEKTLYYALLRLIK